MEWGGGALVVQDSPLPGGGGGGVSVDPVLDGPEDLLHLLLGVWPAVLLELVDGVVVAAHADHEGLSGPLLRAQGDLVPEPLLQRLLDDLAQGGVVLSVSAEGEPHGDHHRGRGDCLASSVANSSYRQQRQIGAIA